MAGTTEELMKYKEDILESIQNLSPEELFLFNEFLIDILRRVNREIGWRFDNKLIKEKASEK